MITFLSRKECEQLKKAGYPQGNTEFVSVMFSGGEHRVFHRTEDYVTIDPQECACPTLDEMMAEFGNMPEFVIKVLSVHENPVHAIVRVYVAMNTKMFVQLPEATRDKLIEQCKSIKWPNIDVDLSGLYPDCPKTYKEAMLNLGATMQAIYKWLPTALDEAYSVGLEAGPD